MNLDELERLEREATAGPWSSTPSDPSQGYECFWITACPEINQGGRLPLYAALKMSATHPTPPS